VGGSMKSSEEPPDVLTVPEFAHRFRLSENLVREMTRDGRLRPIRFGRAVRIPKTEVARLLGSASEER